VPSVAITTAAVAFGLRAITDPALVLKLSSGTAVVPPCTPSSQVQRIPKAKLPKDYQVDHIELYELSL
jgi:hypothetical protein